jgi:hypothetical protein
MSEENQVLTSRRGEDEGGSCGGLRSTMSGGGSKNYME